MNSINCNHSIHYSSGVWNRSDSVALIVTTALAAIALTIGVLGVFASRGVQVGFINAIGVHFSQETWLIVSGVGATLLIGTMGMILYKSIKEYRFKKSFEGVKHKTAQKPHVLRKSVDLNHYEVDIDESFLIPRHFQVFTQNKCYCFGSIESFVTKINELEKQGIQHVNPFMLESKTETVPQSKESQLGHPQMYLPGMVITVISLIIFVVPFFFPFPYCRTIQTAAVGILGSVAYGILNDLIALRQSKHYFILGHSSSHKRLLKTENLTANAIVWGVHASWIPGLIAGVIMAVAATVTHSFAINPLLFTPIAVAGSMGIFFYAHVKSTQIENAYNHPIVKHKIDYFFNLTTIEAKNGKFDKIYLRNIPEKERAGWLAVGRRNRIGYIALCLLGIILLISVIAARLFLAIV